MWLEEANKVCEGREFSEEYILEYTYKQIPDFVIIPYIITVKRGIAVCEKQVESKNNLSKNL